MSSSSSSWPNTATVTIIETLHGQVLSYLPITPGRVESITLPTGLAMLLKTTAMVRVLQGNKPATLTELVLQGMVVPHSLQFFVDDIYGGIISITPSMPTDRAFIEALVGGRYVQSRSNVIDAAEALCRAKLYEAAVDLVNQHLSVSVDRLEAIW